MEKFRNHNAQWLCMVESQQYQGDQDEYTEADDDGNNLEHYLQGEYLSNCKLFNKDGEESDINNTSILASPVSSTT